MQQKLCPMWKCVLIETLTGHVGAGTVICSVLKQPLLPLLFGVRVPGSLGALWRSILNGVVVELKALTFRSGLTLVPTTPV